MVSQDVEAADRTEAALSSVPFVHKHSEDIRAALDGSETDYLGAVAVSSMEYIQSPCCSQATYIRPG